MAGEPLITVVGNLVADPEARVSQAGKPWVTFRIASSPRVRDRQTGEYSDGEPLWLGCRANGELADHIVQSLVKGTRVIMQGRLSQRTYEQDGQKRTSLDFDVEAIGPELRFNSVTVNRRESSQNASQGGFGGGSPQGQGQWSPAPANGPQNGGQGFGGGFTDEQPF